MPNSFLLEDSGSNYGTVTVNDSGTLQTAAASVGSVNTLIVDDPSGASNWQIGVNTSGALTTTALANEPRVDPSHQLDGIINRIPKRVLPCGRRPAIQPCQSPNQKHSGDEIDQFLSALIHCGDKRSSSLYLGLSLFRRGKHVRRSGRIRPLCEKKCFTVCC
jgi:hypothetical protein